MDRMNGNGHQRPKDQGKRKQEEKKLGPGKRGVMSRLRMKWATGLMLAGGVFSTGQAATAAPTKTTPKAVSTSKIKNAVKKTVTSARKIGSNNFTLLNKYKQDLKKFGAVKLEGYQKKMQGVASWYGGYFHGRLTASGRRFSTYAHMAAHKSLPFGTLLRVTNPSNGKSVVVEILDRGPYVAGRMLDLSKATADKLGFENAGTAKVQAEILRMGNLKYEIEAPLSAAEMRGDVISHRINLEGIEQTPTVPQPIAEATDTPSPSGSFPYRVGFSNLLPVMESSIDAVASSIREAVANFTSTA